ncbi:hypothetical protein ACFWNG_03800 [Streptomyces sp. NPDC058391]|uniref:hypothetical protein n=1 Tax=Streptomyces sp. NPDC058391 TaxID=3346476 RepID=UPI0036629577
MPSERPYQLAWYGCDLRTGGIVEDLPSLKSPPLSRRLGQATTAQFDLQLGGAPTDWVAATTHGRSLLVAVDTLTDIPIWAGSVLRRNRGSSLTAPLACATLEAYFDRRYTGTVTLTGADQAAVVSALAANLLTNGPPFLIDAPNTGVTMDFSVLNSDDKTVGSALAEVMGMEGGPEWTVDVEWADANHTAFRFPLRVRPKIGNQAAQPEATFDFPGSVTEYDQEESYEDGKGATAVIARGEGEGESRLSSASYVADGLIASGMPMYVYRYSPASGLTDPDQLNAHAAKALGLMGTGASAWSVTAVASAAPRLGTDWGLGDTIRLDVAPGGQSPGHPQGASVVARAWAWDLDVAGDTITPILVEEA